MRERDEFDVTPLFPEGLPNLDSHAVILARHARHLLTIRQRLDSNDLRLDRSDGRLEKVDAEMSVQTKKLDLILTYIRLAGVVLTPALAAAVAALVAYITRAH